MSLLALCCACGRGAGAYCCPPPGAQGQDGEHPAAPLRVDADADGDWCYEELPLPVSTPPRVLRGLVRGEEDDDAYGADDDELERTTVPTRGAPGLREDAGEAENQQLVSPAWAPSCVGSAKSWIASVYERLSRTFSGLL